VNVEFTAGAGQNACTLQGVVRGHEMGGDLYGILDRVRGERSGRAPCGRRPRRPPPTCCCPSTRWCACGGPGATQVLCRIDAVSETEVHLGCLPAGLSVGRTVSLAILGGPLLSRTWGPATSSGWRKGRQVEFAHQAAPRALVVLLHRARHEARQPLEVRIRLRATPARRCSNQPPVPGRHTGGSAKAYAAVAWELAAGKRTSTRRPLPPGPSVRSTMPPCPLAISCTMARPSPAPSPRVPRMR